MNNPIFQNFQPEEGWNVSKIEIPRKFRSFEKYCIVEKATRERGKKQDKRKNTKSWKGGGERVGGLCLSARFAEAQCVCLLILFLYVATRFKFRIPARDWNLFRAINLHLSMFPDLDDVTWFWQVDSINCQ